MANKPKQIEYCQSLCDVLNEAGIKQKLSFRTATGENQYSEWFIYKDMPEAFFSTCFNRNENAFMFLKNKGLIDIGICPYCGEYPIKNNLRFTDGFNPKINYAICEDCYYKGTRLQAHYRNEKANNGSGCYIATACYGDCNSVEIISFKRFRNKKLVKTFFGRKFIQLYYKLSPNFAYWMKDKKQVNKFVKVCFLNNIYRIIKH